MSNDLSARITPLLPALTALRQALHAHPELGFEEHATAARIAAELTGIPGLEVRTGVARTGIVATLCAEKPGPCVLLRADMDALPITEETGLPYASRVRGRMHACGHDGHVTCLVGAAKVLSELADRLTGPVKFVFQPAEESDGGGRTMCAEGVLENPRVAAAFALHAWPLLPVGTVGVRAGAAMAATDTLDIVVTGKGTHAATPYLGADPIVAAAYIVTALQTVVARHLPPQEPAVVTVARITGGTTHNVIPERVTLRGTIRTLRTATRRRAAELVRRVVEGTAAAHGTQAEVTIEWGYPVLVNDASLVSLVEDTARTEFGDDAVREVPVSLGGEDFAYYAEGVPAAMWRLGTARGDAAEVIPLHSARFDFADAAIAVGVRLHCALALRGADAPRSGLPPTERAVIAEFPTDGLPPRVHSR